MLVTHFHPDHMGGLADVARSIPIEKVLDRGWPDYDYPRPLDSERIRAYRELLTDVHVEAFEAGRNDQIVLTGEPESYPDFEIRNLTANGEYWTGRGDETR